MAQPAPAHLPSPQRRAREALGDTDAHDPLRAHGLPVSEVEHTWAEPGPLGLQLKAQDWVGGRPEIAELHQPELERVLAPRMAVLALNGEPTDGMSFEQVIDRIRTAARPLTIKFCAPPEGLMAGLYRKYWRGEYTEEELRGWLVAGLGLPVPLSSFVIKAITGGRTPTLADPLFMMLGMDNFWSGQNVSQYLLSHADQLPSGTASVSGVKYYEHTWTGAGGLGLRLEPLGVLHGVQRGARIQTKLGEDLPGELTAGMSLVEINGEDVTTTLFDSIVAHLQNAERPIHIRFANVFAAQAAMWAFQLATFGT